MEQHKKLARDGTAHLAYPEQRISSRRSNRWTEIISIDIGSACCARRSIGFYDLWHRATRSLRRNRSTAGRCLQYRAVIPSGGRRPPNRGRSQSDEEPLPVDD